jgi:glutamyl-tRNA synthetase
MESGFRTRFAPSPTGPPHLGTLHTALFAFIAARAKGGVFVLRMDDTDRERSLPEWENEITGALGYLGLKWDEGPDVGGRFGPYRQSERLEIYSRGLDRLRESGFAYRCFCSEADLAIQRAAARASGHAFIYDGRCRMIGPAESDMRAERGTEFVWRFHVDPARLGKTVEFQDLVFGPQNFRTDLLGDFVCMRSDGTPTYMFASPLDDVAMGITHVIRGSDHLPNTAAQILLLKAVGHEPPLFAHLPLIVGIGGKKLSKRDSLTGLDEIRRSVPQALLNHLALLGWTHPDSKEVLSLQEIIESFTFNRVSTSPAAHDPVRLSHLEREHIRRMSAVGITAAFRQSTFGAGVEWSQKLENGIIEMTSRILDEVTSLEQIEKDILPLMREPATEILRAEFERMDRERAIETLSVFLKYNEFEWSSYLKKLADTCGKKEIFMSVRIALTGMHRGFELSKVLDGLPVDEVRRRAGKAIEIIEGIKKGD